MRFNIAKTLVCAAALVALSAQAQGPYVGGSIGGTKYKGDDIGGLATDRTSTGGKLYGGYAFNPHIALELGYADLGKFSSPAGSVKGKGVFLDGVGTIPITQRTKICSQAMSRLRAPRECLGNAGPALTLDRPSR